MKSEEILEKTDRYIMGTYPRFPIALVRGEGSRVWDADGKEYLDFFAGLAVCNLGHCHPKVVAALREQAGTLWHVSNLFYTEPQSRLAELLVENTFADAVFFGNSGAEANEGAFKLARKFSHDRHGPGRHEILSTFGSFHGRTLATLSATGQEKVHAGFEPLVDGFRYVPYGDAAALEATVSPKTAAVVVEPIQGEGGVVIPSDGYLARVREICDAHGLLLIFDEVQTGMGRTGRFLAHEHWSVAPDVATLAKGLGGGIPIGAILAKGEAAKTLTKGSHASTFGGNPLAAACGVAAVSEVVAPGFLDSVRRKGEVLLEKLGALRSAGSGIREVRGKGLMAAAVLDREGGPIVAECMRRGLLINCTQGTVLRFLPPLTITEGEIDRMVEILGACLRDVRR